MKKLAVPYYSQRLDVKDPYWKPRACGMASLKMAMDFLSLRRRTSKSGKIPSLDSLIKEGVSYEAHSTKYGWFHDGLLKIAKNHGFRKSFRKEWNAQIQNPIRQPADKIQNNKNEKQMIRYIVSFIKKGIPVMASVKGKAGGHLVLLVGFSDKGFFYHDPNAKVRAKGKNKFISTEKFLNIWKGRIIAIN